MEIIGVLLVLMALALGAVGVAVVVHELVCPANDRQRLRNRTRRAEQEIMDVGRWEQQAILDVLLRRTAEWAGNETIIDGEIIDSGDS